MRPSTPRRPAPSEPRLVALALGALATLGVCILAIAETDDIWIVAFTVIAIVLIGAGIVIDVARLAGTPEEDAATDSSTGGARELDYTPLKPGPDFTGVEAPDRVIVVTSDPLSAGEVTRALSQPGDDQALSVMIVTPEGFGHGTFTADDERHYIRAREAEGQTVAALRAAGVKATGHVGDHDARQAIEDALALFPASRVVVMAREREAQLYRERVDLRGLERSAGVPIGLVETGGRLP